MEDYSQSLKDKNIIVTGANTGIGYEAALDFAKRGANLILACRNEKLGDEAVGKIKADSKNDNVQLELLDLSSLANTRAFAQRILAKWNRLDILVNNAGIAGVDHKLTADGFETHFQYEKTPYRKAGFECYGQSKLAQILNAFELSKRLEGTGVTAVSLHPGTVHTDMCRNRGSDATGLRWFIMRIQGPLIRWFGLKAVDGAQTTIYCATSEEVPNHSGKYFAERKVEIRAGEVKENVYDSESAAQLWDVSSKLVGLDP